MIKTFEFLINTGVESIGMIADAEKKALACAELAKAIAMTGALKSESISEDVEEVQEPVEEAPKATKKTGKKNAKKDALKPAASKAQEPVEIKEEEPVVPAEPEMPAAEEVPATPEVEIVDEWTDAMVEAKTEQLGLLNSYVEAWGEDYVYNDCLSCFTEGAFTGAENVLPTNIDGFVVYLNELQKQFAEEQ